MFPGAICETCGKVRGGEDRVASLERQLAEAQAEVTKTHQQLREHDFQISALTAEHAAMQEELLVERGKPLMCG